MLSKKNYREESIHSILVLWLLPETYISNEATGANGVIEAIPALIVGVLPFREDVLVAHILGSLIDDPGSTLHPNRVTAAEVGTQLGTVTAAFEVTTLEVLVLVKKDLQARV